MVPHTLDPLPWALAYGRLGWAAFPCWSYDVAGGCCACGDPACDSPGKHPIPWLAPHGSRSATSDPATIEAWWRESPTANIAIATGSTSRLVVIDGDTGKGADREAFAAKYGPLPRAPEVRTGSGGWHLYFGGDDTIPNSASKVAPWIDVRGRGGYVIAPPSLHRSGGRYLWTILPSGVAP